MLGRAKVPRGALAALRSIQFTTYINSGMYDLSNWGTGTCATSILDGALNVPDLSYLTSTFESGDITSVYEMICFDNQLIQNLTAAPVRVQIFPFIARDWTTASPATMLSDFQSTTTWGFDYALNTSLTPNATTSNQEIWTWPQTSPFQVPYWWRKYALSPRKPMTFIIAPYAVKIFRRKRRCLLARENLKLLASSAVGMLPYISERFMLRASGMVADAKSTNSDATTAWAINTSAGNIQVRWLNKYMFRRAVQDAPSIIGSVFPYIVGSTTVYQKPTTGVNALVPNRLGQAQDFVAGTLVSIPGPSGNANVTNAALAVGTAGPASAWNYT